MILRLAQKYIPFQPGVWRTKAHFPEVDIYWGIVHNVFLPGHCEILPGSGALACIYPILNIHFQPWGQPIPCRVHVGSSNLTKIWVLSGQSNKTA